MYLISLDSFIIRQKAWKTIILMLRSKQNTVCPERKGKRIINKQINKAKYPKFNTGVKIFKGI